MYTLVVGSLIKELSMRTKDRNALKQSEQMLRARLEEFLAIGTRDSASWLAMAVNDHLTLKEVVVGRFYQPLWMNQRSYKVV